MVSEYYSENALSVRFYDAVTSIDSAVKDDVDVDFYESYLSSPTQLVLEIGCGTGRVSNALAARGYRVIGIDNSEPMLRRARLKCQKMALAQSKNVQFLQRDMRTLDLPLRFNLIIVPYYTFNHLKELALRAQCLAAITKHLLPGAHAIIHAASPDVVNKPRGERKHVFRLMNSPDTKVSSARLEVTWRPSDIDMKQQSLTQIVDYALFAADGTVAATSAERLILWWFSDSELQMAAQKAGMVHERTLTSFRSEQGRERIYVLRKPS
jgi:SAM-dependent methyltransferase